MKSSHDLAPPPVDGRRPHFALTRKANGFLYMSGQLPFGPDMTIEGDDVATQTRVCVDNIAHLLAEHGLDLSDVTKTTIWLARVEDFAAFNHAYAAAFPGPELPTRSTVRADLMVHGALVEIEALALLRDGQS